MLLRAAIQAVAPAADQRLDALTAEQRMLVDEVLERMLRERRHEIEAEPD